MFARVNRVAADVSVDSSLTRYRLCPPLLAVLVPSNGPLFFDNFYAAFHTASMEALFIITSRLRWLCVDVFVPILEYGSQIGSLILHQTP